MRCGWGWNGDALTTALHWGKQTIDNICLGSEELCDEPRATREEEEEDDGAHKPHAEVVCMGVRGELV